MKEESNFVGRKHERFIAAVKKSEMLATTKVKMSSSEKKKVNRYTAYNISSIKRTILGSFWKFHAVVVENKGKEMYKKLCCTCRVVSYFFAN